MSAPVRRGGWGLLSQAVNSIGNLALAVVVARAVGAPAFGAWSLGFAAYVLVVTAARQILAVPMLLSLGNRAADRSASRERHAYVGRGSTEISGCVSACVALGLAVSVLLVATSPVLPALLGTTGLLIAALIPGLVLQDVLRYVSFAHGDARGAAASDAIWAALQAIGFGVLLVLDVPGVVWPSIVWGGAAVIASAPTLWRWRPRLAPRYALGYVRGHVHQLPALAGDYSVVTVTSQLLPFVVAGLAGLAATAGLRAGLLLLGMVNVVIQGLMPIATVESARLTAAGRPFARRFVGLWSVCVGVLSATYGGLCLVLPDRVGLALFAQSWIFAQPVLVPLVLSTVLSGPMIATQIVLRASGQLRIALLLRSRTAVALIALPAAGTLVSGAGGAAWGLAVATAIGALLALRVLGSVAPTGGARSAEAASRQVEPGVVPA